MRDRAIDARLAPYLDFTLLEFMGYHPLGDVADTAGYVGLPKKSAVRRELRKREKSFAERVFASRTYSRLVNHEADYAPSHHIMSVEDYLDFWSWDDGEILSLCTSPGDAKTGNSLFCPYGPNFTSEWWSDDFPLTGYEVILRLMSFGLREVPRYVTVREFIHAALREMPIADGFMRFGNRDKLEEYRPLLGEGEAYSFLLLCSTVRYLHPRRDDFDPESLIELVNLVGFDSAMPYIKAGIFDHQVVSMMVQNDIDPQTATSLLGSA